MKKYLLIFVALVSISILYAFQTYTSRVDELLKTLGIPSTHARLLIWKSFAGKSFSVSVFENAPKLSAGKRASIVRELGGYVKGYILSPDFNRQYQLFREQSRPMSPVSVQQRIDHEIKEYTLLLQASEAALRRATAELKSVHEEHIRKIKQRVTALENEYDPQHSGYIQGIITQYDYDMSDYTFKLSKFEKEYPADVKAFIKLRLREFIQLSSTVDFDASLIEKDGTQKFADSTYEEKPQAWKFCFLAGKESTEAARSLAIKWIKEL